MFTRRFFYVSLGILALSIAYHLGASRSAADLTASSRYVPILSGECVKGWLDTQTGCFNYGPWNGVGRRGLAPSGTHWLVDGGGCINSGSISAFRETNEHYSALWIDCTADPVLIGPWSGPGEFFGECDPTSVPRSSDAAKLESPRPNPFNPSTEIAFALDAEGMIEVSIYSPSGQRVRILVDEHLGAGAHAVLWDGHDDAGRSLASGTYVYQLRVNGRVVGSEKAVVLR